jgi:hypothetical protein
MGDAERGAPHGEVARQSHVRGGRYRLGPRESLPRCWIGGGRMHLLGEITHPTRALGEVAAPVAVVAQPFGFGGEPGQRARLGRAVADAPVEHGGGIGRPTSATRQRSPFLAQSVSLTTRRRSLCRVNMTSPALT